jgi:putative tricarboxylic transport membrane protein
MAHEGEPIETRRRADRAALAVAAGLFLLAAVVAWDTSRITVIATYARVGPQTFPYVIALCLAGLGVWTVIEALRGDFPERERQEFTPVLWIVAGLLAQLALLRVVGFSLATGLMFGLVAFGMGYRKLWLAIPVGILVSLLVWLIFARGLALTLPSGPLEAAAASAAGSLITALMSLRT